MAVNDESKPMKGKLFHPFDENGSHSPPNVCYKLLKLDWLKLQHVRESPVHPTNLECWCKYPPGMMHGIRYDFRIGVMRKVFEKLPLMKNLLPSPYQTVIPRTSLVVRGEMLLVNRSEHTKNEGKGWMATGEIDLMISILMFDGRYQDSCFVMPCGQCDNLSMCFGHFKTYKEACGIAAHIRKKNKTMETKTKDYSYLELISTQFKKSFRDIQDDYSKARKWLLENVVIPNPGLLERKAIIFPCHEHNHWSATFVFNASFHQDLYEAPDVSGTQANKANVQQACFFRYCSIKTDGSRTVKHAQGICWFLNLCHSYNVHSNKNLTIDQKMSWLEPFGEGIEGNMSGTQAFPALRVSERSNQLPRQLDDWNCGIGIAAAIGIILRDVVFDGAHVTFDSRFMRNTLIFLECPHHQEVYCEFPSAVFQEQPNTASMDYLWHLR